MKEACLDHWTYPNGHKRQVYAPSWWFHTVAQGVSCRRDSWSPDTGRNLVGLFERRQALHTRPICLLFCVSNGIWNWNKDDLQFLVSVLRSSFDLSLWTDLFDQGLACLIHDSQAVVSFLLLNLQVLSRSILLLTLLLLLPRISLIFVDRLPPHGPFEAKVSLWEVRRLGAEKNFKRVGCFKARLRRCVTNRAVLLTNDIRPEIFSLSHESNASNWWLTWGVEELKNNVRRFDVKR